MADKKVLLIGEKQIKELSVLEQNIDSKVLSISIMNVQELQLKPVLGKPLYDRVIDTVYSATTDSNFVINDITKELLSYIKPFLVYAVLVDFIVTNNYKISNKGTLKLNDNSATNLNTDELQFAKNYYDNKQAAYKAELIKFIDENQLVDYKRNLDRDVTSTGTGWFLDVPFINQNQPEYISQTADNVIGGNIGSPVINPELTFTENFTVNLADGKTFGKYLSGEVVPASGKSAVDVIKLAAIEYINPVFTAFTVDYAHTVEVGTFLSGNIGFNWGISSNSGVVPTASIYDITAGVSLIDGIANNGFYSAEISPVTLNEDGAAQSWRMIGNNTDNSTTFQSSAYTVTARYKIFYSSMGFSPATSDDIRALNSVFSTGGNVITLSTGTEDLYFVVAVPEGKTIQSVYDTSALNYDLTSRFILTPDFVVNDAGSNPVLYNLYVYSTSIPYSSSHNLRITIN